MYSTDDLFVLYIIFLKTNEVVDMEDFVMPEFPHLEYELLNKIVKKFKNWDLLELPPEECIQEVMIVLLKNRESWEDLRNKSNSYRMIEVALSRYTTKVVQKHIRDKFNFTHEELSSLIKEQIEQKNGACYEYYYTLKPNEKEYFDECYVKPLEISKAQVSRNKNITYSRLKTIESNMKQQSRLELKTMITTIVPLGEI